MSIVFRPIRDREFGAWVILCAEAFDMPPDEFYEHYIYDPDADADGILVADDNGRLVSSVRVFSREIYISGENVKCGAIGEVCTLPEYRGRGYNAELLKLSVDYMNERSMPISILITEINDYYARYGWFDVPRNLVDITLMPRPLPKGYSLCPARPCDAKALASLYDKHNRSFNGIISRERYDDLYWYGWMKRNEGKRLVLCSDDDIAAYIDFNHTSDSIVFHEFTGPKQLFTTAFSAINQQPFTLRSVPVVLAPENTKYYQSNNVMARLNRPFSVAGKQIDSNESLLESLDGMTIFTGDYF